MAVEAKRKCGFRKVGGLYLCGDGSGIACHRLPMNIHVCPVCSSGLKYSRGFTWMQPLKFFGTCKEMPITPGELCGNHWKCAVCFPPEGKHGLMWIGKKFYSPAEFTNESIQLGVSKRISAIPRDFVLGETVIYLAHLEGGEAPLEEGDVTIMPPQGEFFPTTKRVPAVFYVFKPTRIEKIITESQAKDEKEMEELTKRGITPVIVPDNDKDHQGSVHDKEEE